jgi:hypothetical protein
MVEQPTFHELESYLARMPALVSPLVVALTRAEDGG